MKMIYVVPFGLAILFGVSATQPYRGNSENGSSSARPRAVYVPDIIAANGLVEGATLEVNLLPEVHGRLTKICVQEQQTVNKGDLLAELNNDSQTHHLALAKAELARAQANLEKVRNGARKEERQALAAVESARKVQYQRAKADYDRIQQLTTSQSVSRSEYDKCYFGMLEAEALWKQAKADLALIQAPARTEDIALAEAEVMAAKARVNQADAELNKTRLLAPFRGRVLRIHVEPGAMVSPEQNKPILSFADLSKRRVRAFVEELDSMRVELGQPAKITADGLAGMEYSGSVTQVFPRMGKNAPRSNAPDEYNDVHFREVLIELNTTDPIPVNMRVDVRITTNCSESENSPPGLAESTQSR